jgi:hypothetical protein
VLPGRVLAGTGPEHADASAGQHWLPGAPLAGQGAGLVRAESIGSSWAPAVVVTRAGSRSSSRLAAQLLVARRANGSEEGWPLLARNVIADPCTPTIAVITRFLTGDGCIAVI